MDHMAVIISALGLLMLYTVTILGGAAWLNMQFKNLKTEILTDFNAKHDANSLNVRALEKLVMRHDIILEPEFSDRLNGRAHHG